MKTITINGQVYEVKQTIRAIFLWEQITGRSFEVKSTMDNYLYYYCIILASNPDSSMTWDDFLDAIDEDSSIILNLSKIIIEDQQRDKMFEGKEEAPDGKKKD